MTENEKIYRKNIGRKIKLARYKKKYTQEALAEKTALSTRYISQLERGIAFGSANTIVQLCKALNISSNFLFDDLVKTDKSETVANMDLNFLEDYSQLNSYNKEVIHRLANDLIKLQLEQNPNKKRI